MSDRVPIVYREFYDVPRMLLARYRQQTILFDCRFDEAAGGYPQIYRVFLLPELLEDDLTGSWAGLSSKAYAYLGDVSVEMVDFDPSKRSDIGRES